MKALHAFSQAGRARIFQSTRRVVLVLDDILSSCENTACWARRAFGRAVEQVLARNCGARRWHRFEKAVFAWAADVNADVVAWRFFIFFAGGTRLLYRCKRVRLGGGGGGDWITALVLIGAARPCLRARNRGADVLRSSVTGCPALHSACNAAVRGARVGVAR